MQTRLVAKGRPRPAEPPMRGGRTGALAATIAVSGWAVLVASAHVWGRRLSDRGVDLLLPTPPLFARLDPRIGPWLLPALLLGAAAVVWAEGVAARASWPRLALAVLLGGTAWAGALAIADGPRAIGAPLLDRHDYLYDVGRVGSPRAFLAGFTRNVGSYATHVRSHPPGMLLLLSGLKRAGLGSPELAAWIVIVAGASSGVAAMAAVREVAGEEQARAAAPFLALAPTALWIATSADALFAGTGAWALALIVAATGRSGWRADRAALGGGLLFGASLLLSYGLVLLAPVAIGVAAARRRLRPVLVAALGGALVLLAAAGAGFWWPQGLRAARLEYVQGAAASRPYAYFLVANLAAFCLALGPASVGGLAHLTAGAASRASRVPLWLLAGGGLLAIVAADLSGLAKGEVERIWLPFAPWVLVACAALPRRRVMRRGWLAAQVGAAIALQVLVVSPW